MTAFPSATACSSMARTLAIRFPAAGRYALCCGPALRPAVREAHAVIVEGAEFVHRNRTGWPARVGFKHYGQRSLVDDLDRVTVVLPGGDD